MIYKKSNRNIFVIKTTIFIYLVQPEKQSEVDIDNIKKNLPQYSRHSWEEPT